MFGSNIAAFKVFAVLSDGGGVFLKLGSSDLVLEVITIACSLQQPLHPGGRSAVVWAIFFRLSISAFSQGKR